MKVVVDNLNTPVAIFNIVPALEARKHEAVHIFFSIQASHPKQSSAHNFGLLGVEPSLTDPKSVVPPSYASPTKGRTLFWTRTSRLPHINPALFLNGGQRIRLVRGATVTLHPVVPPLRIELRSPT